VVASPSSCSVFSMRTSPISCGLNTASPIWAKRIRRNFPQTKPRPRTQAHLRSLPSRIPKTRNRETLTRFALLTDPSLCSGRAPFPILVEEGRTANPASRIAFIALIFPIAPVPLHLLPVRGTLLLPWQAQ
jgi:hypothetical protein